MSKRTPRPSNTKLIADLTAEVKDRAFWKDEELQQVFWLGVMRKIDRCQWAPSLHPIRFLTTQGANEVRHWIQKQYSVNLQRYCSECNRFYGYRHEWCDIHHKELPVRGRYSVYVDALRGSPDEDVIEEYSMEQFVKFLGRFESESVVHVAQRWLVDRVDIYYDNHSKQLALELDLTPPRIAQIKKHIREILLEWDA